MGVEIRLVDGPAFASEASRILSDAWSLPSLNYSPGYLSWQLSFPGPWKAPAVAAFDGAQPVGFAACTNRRFRCGSKRVDALAVSFVAVAAGYRNQGVAAALYESLLTTIGEIGAAVVTFGQAGSAGQRAIERAYPPAGFVLAPLGSFPLYAFIPRGQNSSPWTAQLPVPGAFESLVRQLAADETVLWSDPTEAQFQHRLADPRRHAFLCLYDASGTLTGGAFVVESEVLSPRGLELLPTLDSVWLSSSEAALLPGLAASVAELWKKASTSTIVHAPSLGLYDCGVLRRNGFRQTGAGFSGYAAFSNVSLSSGLRGSNLEIV